MSYLCDYVFLCIFFFFFKQKTAYEMRISDWSSDVCSSDLVAWDEAFPDQPHVRMLDGTDQTLNRGGKLSPMAKRGTRLVAGLPETGRASCRERVCQYVSISVVDESVTKHNRKHRKEREHKYNIGKQDNTKLYKKKHK